jgi:Bacteriophage head to tail connecting protein
MATSDYLDLSVLPTSGRAWALMLKSSLENERSSFLSHWRELGEFFKPRRTRFWPGDRNQGDKRNQKIKDSSPGFAVRTFSSGLHAGLTNPSRPWLKLTHADPDLAEYGPAKSWLHHVTQRMLSGFAQANLYLSLPTVYTDLGIFGTAAVGMLDDGPDLFRFWNYPIGSFAYGLDERGRVAMFSREFELSVYQVIKEYAVLEDGRTIDWTRVSPGVKRLYERAQYLEPIEICWVIAPNAEYDPRVNLGPRSFKWTSVHFETGSRTAQTTGYLPGDYSGMLRVSGFREFPILGPRWETTGEDSYGTDCPGMTVLPDVKQLNSETTKKGQAIEKKLNPPLVAPPQLRSARTSLIAGDITWLQDPTGKALRPIHEVQMGIQEIREDIADLRNQCRRAFYEDLFLLIASTDQALGAERPTAREIDARKEEQLIALGPALERTNDELLDPLADRWFAGMQRAGLLPEAPPELQGERLKVEYVNYLSQAQKLLGVATTDRFLTTVVNLAATWPRVRYKVREFQAVDEYADRLGVNPEMVVSDEEAEAAAQADAQAQQEAAQAAAVPGMAGAAKDLSQAEVTPDNALGRLIQRAGGTVQ